MLLQVLVLWSGMEGAAAIRSVICAGTDALLTRGGVGAGHPKLRVNVATAGSVVNVVNIDGGRVVPMNIGGVTEPMDEIVMSQILIKQCYLHMLDFISI